MKRRKFWGVIGCIAMFSGAGLLFHGCKTVQPEPEAKVTEAGGPSIQEAQSAAYNGPQARIAVSRFTDKTRKGWYSRDVGDGMADMLATALFHTNRYIVLERQQLGDVLREQDLGASGRVKQDTAAPIGEIEGAELLITGAVTEFEGAASGAGGGVGGWGGGVVGAVLGAYKKAHMAIDVRVIDTRTSRIVAVTSVEGSATDISGLGALGGAVGGGALGGALSGWSKTPTEKALRICIQKSVDFVVSKTPVAYYHFGSGGTAVQPTSLTPASTTPPTQGPTVEITGSSVNIRSGPGTSHNIVGSVKRGDRLDLLGESGNWFQVRMPNGKVGYIFNKLCK
jgi:curli biogenesis system outer membrane secretion channel CsgG